MILVIGATGTVGREVVAGLTAAGHRVRAFTRAAARAGFGPGVEPAEGDLARPETVRAALAGVDGVFVLSAGPDAAAHEAAVAEAVRRGGVRKVVKLSSVAADEPVVGAYGHAQADAERAFARSGAEWTALRAAGFMSNVLQWRASIAAEGRVYQTYGDIPRAVVDPADVAAAAVVCLTSEGHGGRIYRLTGPEALTAPEQAAKVARLLGRPLEYVEAPPEAAARAMAAGGLPPAFAAGLLDALADPDPRRGGTPLPTVQELTGRPAGTFDAWLLRHRGELDPRQAPAR
ncbi:nucleoside-diphosphate sugar epimerase [Kitasatospora sp. MMS16-BH015]|uniref:NAD(P)H-binding protein n=1 Tax=Kitasatospora sp. MMS16-BH015 TaxID=2018025 RepID=UPI000CA24033|nr:NAD(P)H-binding protein [Kitasatospora sp. MMS16-BH015]AUG78926.1 nucleoside-diphosphate sugar epimerase [Kitasatospora sp. MMS16-BH015]